MAVYLDAYLPISSIHHKEKSIVQGNWFGQVKIEINRYGRENLEACKIQ